MDADEIARLRELCERATEGPWEYVSSGGTIFYVVSHKEQPNVAESTLRCDAEFIAAAREALPKLLNEVERLHNIIDCQDPPRLSVSDIAEASKLFGSSIVDSPARNEE